MHDVVTHRPRILYIRRFYHKSSWPRWARSFVPRTRYNGQEGFFRGALHTMGHVTEKDLFYLQRHRRNVARRFDWIVINFKASLTRDRLFPEDVTFLDNIDCPKALVMTNAQARGISNDDVLDHFDLVFKRELLRDLERYPLSNTNRAKLRVTTLACPLIPATRRNLEHIHPSGYGFATPSDHEEHDAFFTGYNTSPIRSDVVHRCLAMGITFSGGLQQRSGRPTLDREVCGMRIPPRDYIATARASRINLALEGIGEFTYRHLELWGLCTFALSTPSIRKVQLPLEVSEGEHYACFEDLDDLEDKVRYYLEHTSERQRMAQAGRDRFERDYDFHKHGRYIAACLANPAQAPVPWRP